MNKRIIIIAVIFIMALFIAACAPHFSKFKTVDNASGEWKMFRNSLNGYYQEGVYGAGIDKLAWKSDLKARSYSSPVATESYVAVGALDSYLYFFDHNTGERINMLKLKAPPSESPLISNKIIYSASGPDKSYLGGINLITGKYVFREDMRDVQSPIIGDEQFIYCGDYSGRFVCLDKFSGKVIWEYRAMGPILSAPAVNMGRIYVGSLDQKLYCLEAKSGEPVWEYEAEGAINSAPAVDRLVYFGSYNGYVYALNSDNGEPIWKYKTGGQIITSPVIDKSSLYIGSNDRKLYCLDKSSGSKVWDYETHGVINSTPLVLEDVVVFCSGDGMIYMLNKRDGSLVFSYETKNMIKSSPIYFNGKIFVSSLDKHLYCFGN
jgi:outer membrane protein assembly factor BamB